MEENTPPIQSPSCFCRTPSLPGVPVPSSQGLIITPTLWLSMSPIPEALGTRRIPSPGCCGQGDPGSGHRGTGRRVWLGGRGRTGPAGRPHQLGTEPGNPAVSGSWSSPDAEVGREECWALTGVCAGSIGEMCPLEKGPPSPHAWEQGESQTWGACLRGERDPWLTWKAARVGNKAKYSGKNCEPWEHPTSVRDKNRN